MLNLDGHIYTHRRYIDEHSTVNFYRYFYVSYVFSKAFMCVLASEFTRVFIIQVYTFHI